MFNIMQLQKQNKAVKWPYITLTYILIYVLEVKLMAQYISCWLPLTQPDPNLLPHSLGVSEILLTWWKHGNLYSNPDCIPL